MRTRRAALLNIAALAAASTAPAPGGLASGEADPISYPPARIEELIRELHPRTQPWGKIPWKASVTGARRAALEQGKPIFLVVNTGNCLGFV